MNQSKKPLEINQDQKKSFNKASAIESNCEMTDLSKKDQALQMQSNERDCLSQMQSSGKEKEQMTPRKPKADINGYSNQ
jgi:hypothetical protein